MYENFLSHHAITSEVDGGYGEVADIRGMGDFLRQFGGCTFDRGFYRVNTRTVVDQAGYWCADLLPGMTGKLFCFAFDWLGRALAIDLREGNAEQVVLVDPGGGDMLESGMSLSEFHETAMVQEDPLARPFYEEWRSTVPDVGDIAPQDCAGYRVPLFLGGQDEVDNIELVPLGVYWSISAQLYRGVRKLKPGTTIRQIHISDGQ